MTDVLPTRVLRTPRSAGIAGVLFALRFAIIVFLLHKVVPVNPHEAGSWVANAPDRRKVSFALTLVPFSGIFFLWFIGAVRSRIGTAEDRFFATVFLGSGLLFVAMMFTATAVMGALISLASSDHGAPPLNVWHLGRATTFQLATTFALRMAAVFTIATSTIALRLRLHHPVVITIGFASGLLLMFVESTIPWIELVFPFWVFVVSVSLLVDSYRERAAGQDAAGVARP